MNMRPPIRKGRSSVGETGDLYFDFKPDNRLQPDRSFLSPEFLKNFQRFWAKQNIFEPQLDLLSELQLRQFSDSLCLESASSFSAQTLLHEISVLSSDLEGRLRIIEKIAVRLGHEWESDRVTIVDMSIAMSRLNLLLTIIETQITHNYSASNTPSLLLLSPEKETHWFASNLCQRFFEIEGWQTKTLEASSQEHLINELSVSYDVIAISWTDKNLKQNCYDLVTLVKKSYDLDTDTILIAGGAAAIKEADWLISNGINNVYPAISDAQVELRNLVDAVWDNKKQRTNSSHIPAEPDMNSW